MTEADDVLAFLRARADSTLRRVPQPARKAVVSSGLPLSVALRTHESLEVFGGIAASYDAGSQALPDLAAAVRAIEDWARAHASSVTGTMPEAGKLDAMREGWLGGTGLQALSLLEGDARAISKDLYGYQLPWIIHAASQQLRGAEEPEKADALAKLALLVELGVPTDLAARIFLAGVRSRAAATELASLDVAFGLSILEISRSLRSPDFADALRPLVSPSTAGWLELMVEDGSRWRRQPIPKFPAFTLKGAEEAELLHARKLGDRIFLATVDGGTRIQVKPTAEFPFNKVADDPRVAFAQSDDSWKLVVRDPRLETEEP
jgi:hypothetical protein